MVLGLSDYQFHYSTVEDTLEFGIGDVPTAVPAVDVVRITGLNDLDVRIGDREFARQDGDIGGLHRAGFREITLQLEVRSSVINQAYWDLVNQVRNIFTRRPNPTDTDGVFSFKWPGEVEKMIRCRPIRRREPREWRSEYGILPMEILLRAADPRIYTPDFVSSGSISGTFNVTNAGNDFAYPELHFTAVTDATVVNNTNSTQVVIVGANNGTGNLRANMDRWIRGVNNDNIIERGANDNYFAWQQPREPLRLDPGINSLTLTVAPSVTVFHRDTWL